MRRLGALAKRGDVRHVLYIKVCKGLGLGWMPSFQEEFNTVLVFIHVISLASDIFKIWTWFVYFLKYVEDIILRYTAHI